MLLLNILFECSSVICDVISVHKHGPLTNEEEILMKTLRLEKGWSVLKLLRMMQEFSS